MIDRNIVLGCLVALTFFAGCDGSKSDHKHDHDHPHEHGHDGDHDHHREGGHVHIAPHDGTLVVFGEEFAHLELVLDAEKGELRAYALDGEAQNGVKLKQETIDLEINHSGKKMSLQLEAVESALSGDKKGSSAEFLGRADALKGLTKFEVKIAKLTIKGQTFTDVTFPFPEGNE